MTGQHCIKRLEVALRAADQQSARQLQHEVSIFCRTELPGLLESAFDGLASDRWLRIDRLELSLPVFTNVDEFRSRLGERLRQILQTRLDEAAASAAAGDATGAGSAPGETAPPLAFDAAYQAADIFIHVLEYGVAPWHAVAANFDQTVQAVGELLETDRAFGLQLATLLAKRPVALKRFVMQVKDAERRRMLAGITRMDESSIEDIEKVLHTVVAVLTRAGAPLPEKTRTRLVAETAVRNLVRLQTLDQAARVLLLNELLDSVLAARGGRAQSVAQDLSLAGMQLEAVLPRRWHPALRESIAGFADAGPGRGGPAPAAGEQEPPADAGRISIEQGDSQRSAPARATENDAVQKPPHAVKTPLDEVRGNQVQPHEDRSLPKQSRGFDAWSTAAPQDTGPAAPSGSEQAKKMAGRRPQAIPSDLQMPGDETDRQGGRSLSFDRDGRGGERSSGHLQGMAWRSPFEKEVFHIENAGLVLVAPFFGTVFKDLGYLDQRRVFVSAGARVRAVHFSQFLVTAEQHPAECGLVLNKILCGMNADEPLERFVDLNEQELAAAAEVLDSALEHWSVLKRTSVPVFRQTFLQHAGILSSPSGHWLLRIERTGVDVLIDTLPWTISVIKHPWMQQPLMVEW